MPYRIWGYITWARPWSVTCPTSYGGILHGPGLKWSVTCPMVYIGILHGPDLGVSHVPWHMQVYYLGQALGCHMSHGICKYITWARPWGVTCPMAYVSILHGPGLGLSHVPWHM